MRILLYLRPTSSFHYLEFSNYYFQGFIYKLLRNSEFHWLHQYKGFKMFNFSNLFPIEKDKIIKQNKIYHIIISSPNKTLIDVIFKNLREYKGKSIKLGNFEFLLEKAKKYKLKLSFPWKTSSPIILTKNKEVYLSDGKEVYKIVLKTLNHPLLKLFKKKKIKSNIHLKNAKEISITKLPYLDNKKFKIVRILDIYYNFEKGDFQLEEWLRDLKDNSLEKYFSFTGYNFYFEEPLFEEVKFEKPVSIRIKMKGKDVIFIGSLWKRLNVLRKLDREEKKFYMFLLDVGLGKLNSLGFGFLNPIKE
ncbi:MAG: CRISPR-associated endoribonuclease Cas6 [Candidatus Aenigmatarchaeota archaeon]